MLECFKFLFEYTLKFITMLFDINVGFTNLGILMCIVYILLPVMLLIVNFIKHQLIDELDDYYDDKRFYMRAERRKKFKESGNK